MVTAVIMKLLWSIGSSTMMVLFKVAAPCSVVCREVCCAWHHLMTTALLIGAKTCLDMFRCDLVETTSNKVCWAVDWLLRLPTDLVMLMYSCSCYRKSCLRVIRCKPTLFSWDRVLPATLGWTELSPSVLRDRCRSCVTLLIDFSRHSMSWSHRWHRSSTPLRSLTTTWQQCQQLSHRWVNNLRTCLPLSASSLSGSLNRISSSRFAPVCFSQP